MGWKSLSWSEATGGWDEREKKGGLSLQFI
jgi:hypothetical protein